MSDYLIIGATGQVGRRVARRVAFAGHTPRLAGFGDTPFDWYDPASYPAALAGAEGVYVAVPGSMMDHAPLAAWLFSAAARLGVRRAVLLSARATVFQPDGMVQRVEDAARASDLPVTILRPTWSAQHFTEGNFVPLHGTVSAPVGDGREPFIDIDDVAAVATTALLDDRHAGETIDLSGPDALTFTEAVAVLAEQTGQPLRFADTEPQKFALDLAAAGRTDAYVSWRMAMFDGIRQERDAFLSDGVERVLGRPATSFFAWAEREASSLGTPHTPDGPAPHLQLDPPAAAAPPAAARPTPAAPVRDVRRAAGALHAIAEQALARPARHAIGYVGARLRHVAARSDIGGRLVIDFDLSGPARPVPAPATTPELTDMQEYLVLLAYELLDAHDDTARLVAGSGSDDEWERHVRYLRDLQRMGREVLAHASVDVGD